MRHTTVGGIAFTLLTWQDVDEITRELAEEVRQSGKVFDRIIAVANGGLTMARHFGDQVGLRKISLIQTAFYAEINETSREPQLLQPLVVNVKNERLLVFEDIVDTGRTLEFLRPLLMSEYGAGEVQVATLIQKPWTTSKADFVAREMDSWIIYPYETQESIRSLQKKWQNEGVNDQEIWKRLAWIGFDPDEIEKFLHPTIGYIHHKIRPGTLA